MPMMLEIITAERQVFSDEVDMVVAPGIDGQLGILPRHAPLMTMLKPGELTVRKAGEEDMYVAVSGGFMEVLGNRVSILADACERSDEIDEERAQQAVQRAQERLASRSEDMELERVMASLRRAQVRVDLVRRRRLRGGQPPPGVGGTTA
ncbi:MAG: F0F1 ATP synthase subunit epsilon [SAR202 cluster bacterium]|nr:F0F1 ATP synthase subunit epsilon [Chloroflexota bacterium]MCH2508975.1 F0F1 ATP synthase subunit epsilon [Dehalococcoidia bacterium]MQG50014.1 F0F1 ATP synthase subunit epsilon [SAR202 cluster bacterium]MAQ53293.1 F0F1 ATP synthase subunit epsilon [Chloroflexota bacterium]MBC51006.1 F0F1 ATP synthase subunit epsilon [Chloroflexota bacterium]